MIGLGAVKPPGGPLPSPLQGLSTAMARAPGEVSTAKSVRRPTPAPSSAMAEPRPAPSPVPPPPAFADGAATIIDVARPAPPAGPAPVALEEEEDEDGLSKAYLAPTSVPKAMLPSNEDDAKVVINIPTPLASSNEEVTATIDREALERQKVRDEQLDAQRRREPTQRIPRKAVQEARREIEERQAREAALELGEDPADVVVDSIRAIPSAPISTPAVGDSDRPAASRGAAQPTSTRPAAAPSVPSSRPTSSTGAAALDATATASQQQPDNDTSEDDAPAPPARTSGRSTTWIAVGGILAAGAAGLWFMLRTPVDGKTNDGASQATTSQSAPAKATTARPTGETAAPPLQLTAEPKTDTPDPHAVHLDQQAAETPSPTPEPTQQPVAPVVAQPRVAPVKPVNTYYTPTDI